MLYTLYEWNRAAMLPVRMLAGAANIAFQNPFAPVSYTQFGRSVVAASEVLERVTRRFEKPEWGLDVTLIGGEPVPVTIETVDQTPFCNLLHFSRDTDRNDPKVLLVAPISGHHATLLRGTVEALLPHHDVYVTDWIDARQVPLANGAFDLDDYVHYLIRFLKLLGADTHVIAVCQPAVPVMAAVSLLASAGDAVQPRTMTLMGGPIDTRRAPTAVTRLAETRPIEWFEHSVISPVPMMYPGALRNVYPGFVQLTGFMQMNLDRHVGAHVKLFQHLVRGDDESADAHRKFYDEYLSVMDLTAEFYLQTVETVFQRHDLPNGTMKVRGVPVVPGDVQRTALLTIEGELDDISAPGQTLAAHDLLTGLPAEKKKAHLQLGVGHYGIFNGRRWRESILPVVRSWIRQHDAGRTEVPPQDLVTKTAEKLAA
ncbi:polyhydroxyalkanoate depolymerase [Roseiterribacter gracilis]|uniref:Esterase n=1 Tax=Roseiterribacter gracilis TaxID=2812848 RepID=A0A8S8XGV5_9PROT|nr:esterase [Rhodospirillales bacterium TMPK1]